MVLNGDILEYENMVGGNAPMENVHMADVLDVAVDAISWLISYLEVMAAPPLLRLRGGLGPNPNWTNRQKNAYWNKYYGKANTAKRQARYQFDEDLEKQIKRQKTEDTVGTGATMVALVGAASYRYRHKGRIFDTQRGDPPLFPGTAPTPLILNTIMPRNIQAGIHKKVMNLRRGGGKNMLEFKNLLTRAYHTDCYYVMSPIKWSDTQLHVTDLGQGPHLYCTHYDSKATGSGDTLKRVDYFGWIKPLDCGTENSGTYTKGVGYENIVYVFAADWPFLIMNHDTETQISTLANKKKGRYLSWIYRAYDTTTDANVPITLDTIKVNKDWTYLTHYYTHYTFEFKNISRNPYIVEVLFFTFKADPDTMDYGRQVRAITKNQNWRMNEYIKGAQTYPEDINIVHRKRILIRGLQQPSWYGTGIVVQGPNDVYDNNAVYSYTVKRRYVMKRPIITDYDTTITEATFFNTYYEPNQGIYCRIQAWMPDSPIVLIQTDPYLPTQLNDEDTQNIPNATNESCTTLGYGISCVMRKQTKFKLDTNIMKGPFKS